MNVLRDKNILGIVFRKLEEKDIFNFCNTCSLYRKIFCNEAFMKRFLKNKYPDIESYVYKDYFQHKYFKKEENKYYNYFLFLIKHKKILKEKYDYDYMSGCILAQEDIFRNAFEEWEDENCNLWDKVVYNSVMDGELEPLKYGIEKGGDINNFNDMEENVCESGNLALIEYVMEKKFFDISTEDYFYNIICYSGDLEIVENFIRKKGCKIDKGAILSAVHGLRNYYYLHVHKVRNILIKEENWNDMYEEKKERLMTEFVNTGESMKVVKYLLEHPTFMANYSAKERLQILKDVFYDFHPNYEMKDYEKAGRDYLLSEISKLEKESMI